ncbi:hypothetical protein COL87_24780 [Bacillus pseudomycoides]|nr:hypothetical protein BLX05_27640 [Bacillus pseudomycoides]PEB38641.1 hypothetical protein COO06_27500 [Bacillus pseudomycoides]PEI37483.1 hypothetical protein CN641_27815 [Bacillus pseudomycoides]PEJ40245.1 hypothetical protein CN677_01550 [Bacillus pseudomycoides]PGA66276.1 hypothetical protein COL87_24780 [Bacillus pseudomycoides]
MLTLSCFNANYFFISFVAFCVVAIGDSYNITLHLYKRQYVFLKKYKEGLFLINKPSSSITLSLFTFLL